MIWLLITTFYSSILLFIALNARMLTKGEPLKIPSHTSNICGIIGVISLTLTGILWTTVYGWQYGLLALVTIAIANYALLFLTKNRLSQVVAGATLLIGGSFLVTTINMVVVAI